MSKLFTYLQYLLPQHLLSRCCGKLAESPSVRFKNFLIRSFIKRYDVDMSTALVEDPYAYPSFNDFFIRQLKPALRPIDAEEEAIVSPVDGIISQIGVAKQNQLLQAKGVVYDLETLLGGDSVLANIFHDGKFATFYLAPYHYHRVHMPFSGKLIKTIYVPGTLFSVNPTTAAAIPQLFARNERLICEFETTAGRMVVILVGALIVGSIQTVWMTQPARSYRIKTETIYPDIVLQKGEELGYFKMGSTVIVLFEKDRVAWFPELGVNRELILGKKIGTIV